MKKFILGGVAGLTAGFILMMVLGELMYRRSQAEIAALPAERALRLQQAQLIGAAYALYLWQHHGFPQIRWRNYRFRSRGHRSIRVG